jgi:hypothetical protein
MARRPRFPRPRGRYIRSTTGITARVVRTREKTARGEPLYRLEFPSGVRGSGLYRLEELERWAIGWFRRKPRKAGSILAERTRTS